MIAVSIVQIVLSIVAGYGSARERAVRFWAVYINGVMPPDGARQKDILLGTEREASYYAQYAQNIIKDKLRTHQALKDYPGYRLTDEDAVKQVVDGCWMDLTSKRQVLALICAPLVLILIPFVAGYRFHLLFGISLFVAAAAIMTLMRNAAPPMHENWREVFAQHLIRTSKDKGQGLARRMAFLNGDIQPFLDWYRPDSTMTDEDHAAQLGEIINLGRKIPGSSGQTREIPPDDADDRWRPPKRT